MRVGLHPTQQRKTAVEGKLWMSVVSSRSAAGADVDGDADGRAEQRRQQDNTITTR